MDKRVLILGKGSLYTIDVFPEGKKFDFSYSSHKDVMTSVLKYTPVLEFNAKDDSQIEAAREIIGIANQGGKIDLEGLSKVAQGE